MGVLSYDAIAVALAEPVPASRRDTIAAGRSLALYVGAVLVGLSISGWLALAVAIVGPMGWEVRHG